MYGLAEKTGREKEVADVAVRDRRWLERALRKKNRFVSIRGDTDPLSPRPVTLTPLRGVASCSETCRFPVNLQVWMQMQIRWEYNQT